MAKNSIMNFENGMNVIVLHHKLNDPGMQYYYNNSVYAWLERDAPKRFLQKFKFRFVYSNQYIDSSFYKWSEDDIMVAVPAPPDCTAQLCYSLFDGDQLTLFEDQSLCTDNIYEKLIQKYINGELHSIQDISLYTADALMSSMKNTDMFFYTPIIIYIIRKVLKMN